MLSPLKILLIALILLLLFGASRLGNIGKGLGEGIRNFKKGLSGDDEDDVEAKPPEPPKQLPPKSEVALRDEAEPSKEKT
jgi:sec-independent protein translocase protein TatA